MLRFLANNLREKCIKTSSTSTVLQRSYMCDKKEVVIGGGLEKPHGGMKEENYFHKLNKDLMDKIRTKGSKLRCESYVTDWNQFEKVLEARDVRTALRETCSLNKHKNCLEEAFFLNEQNICYTKLCKEKEEASQRKCNEKLNKQTNS